MLTIGPGPVLVTAAQMRAAEAAAIAAGTSAQSLMARAARAAAHAIQRFSPQRAALVLCGPGNNGGDGFGVAIALQAAGVDVRVAAMAMPVSEPAAGFAARWPGPVTGLAEASPAPLIIDALFGTGLVRPLESDVQSTLDRLRGSGRVVAIDIASGIDADTGTALGRPLPADMTITFAAAKRGHVLGAGLAATGRLAVADIGIAVTDDAVRRVAPPIRVALAEDTHKYQRGGVMIIGGEQPGAARLAALAALRAGAGAVTLAGGAAGVPLDAIMQADDAMALRLLDTPKLRAIAIGPGLAPGQRATEWLVRLLAGTTPLVIDAGALALLRGPPDFFAAARAPLVLTPHAGEFARLFGPMGDDPVAAVAAAAKTSGAVVIAKGRATIIAAPDGRVAINSHATPWLATAGSGDVLAGMIAALLAQGLAPFDAAQAAVWLHGDAGLRGGPGLVADDIPALLPAVLAAL